MSSLLPGMAIIHAAVWHIFRQLFEFTKMTDMCLVLVI